MIFGIKKKDNFDPYNVLLAIATNIPVLLMTAFVLQGHIWTELTDLAVFRQWEPFQRAAAVRVWGL